MASARPRPPEFEGSPRVLLVDDDASFRRVAQYNLEESGCEALLAGDGREALDRLVRDRPAIMVTDLKMPGMDGMELLARAREMAPSLPIIVITAFGSIDTAVEAMKKGADDFITKPFDRDDFLKAVAKALRVARLEDENRRLKTQLRQAFDPSRLVGASPAMERVAALVRKLTRTDAGVLILGESGSGKEVVAAAIHHQSERASTGRFVPVNCGAIPRELLESELFGHVRGSFTGAVADRVGKFEAAHGGTLFLDEVGDMPLELQAKILRAVQEKEVERVGGDGRPRPVDVRILAATNRDLRAMVASGEFREDLYYRLAVVELRLPPLRERGDDVLLLAKHFIEKHCPKGLTPPRLDPQTRQALLAHRWPGNVRELENAIQRALALMEDPETIRLEDLPESVRDPASDRLPPALLEIPDSGIILDDV
jgi:DNA-binding NtrC family response regulator